MAGPYYTSRCSLPSAWETRVSGIRNQHALQYLKVDGTRVRYVGPGNDDQQAATVRANYPLPSDCPLYYFEIKVLDRGREGFIGVGFCTADVVLSRLPGWDAHSYGYHGDDGNAFAGSGQGRAYGPPYTTGDVVGVLYNRSDNSISYFKNGEPLGPAFRDVAEASPLYPCVGLRTRGEEIVANFGAGPSPEPFRTDFPAIQAAFQRRVMESVRSTPLPLLSSRGTSLLPQLMYDYLLHQRYARTAAVLARDLLRGTGGAGGGAGGSGGGLGERELSDIAVRQQSYDLVASGRIDEALALLREKYPPELLSERPSLDFRLHLQKFVEMVAVANAAGEAATPQKAPPGGGRAGGGGGGQKTARHVKGGAKGAEERGDEEEAASVAAKRSGAAGGPPGGEPSNMDTRDGEDRATLGSMGAAVQASVGGTAAGEEELRGPGCGGEPGAGHTGGEPTTAAAAPAPTTTEILAYGSSELMPRCRTASDRDLLTDALSLLAFHDPAASPAGYLLRPSHRVALAEELNGALLAVRGLPATSPLERLYQQAAAVMTELKRSDHPQALALPDPRLLVLDPPATSGPSGSGSGGDPGGGSGSAGGGDGDVLMS